MAPSAVETTADQADATKPPQGVVIPPKEIRNVLEKTASYVARNGIVFEERIREKEKGNPKFNFLTKGDPYNAYYLWRLQEIKEGRGDAGKGKPGQAQAAAAPEEPKGPPQPPDYEFSARVPRINRKDLDVLQLTALYVAQHGRPFMTGLAQREAGNPQFAFLTPNHTFHNYFQSLVDQYTSLIRAAGVDGRGGKVEQERMAALQKMLDDRFLVLERAKQRAIWEKHQQAEKERKDEEELIRKYEYALVDWNDFVVVETIVFTDADNESYLPPPTTLADLEYASLEEKNKMSISASMRIEEAMPTDSDAPEYYNAYPVTQPQPQALPYHLQQTAGADQQQQQQQQQQKQQQPQQAAESSTATAAQFGYNDEDEVAARMREREEQRQRLAQSQAAASAPAAGIPAMKIRENYVPRVGPAAGKTAGAVHMTLCPNCGQQIPVSEYDAHVRIELLDPRWKEQKAKADARSATTNLRAADAVVNVKRLASQRGDVFDPNLLPASDGPDSKRPRTDAVGPQQPQRPLMTAVPPGAGGIVGAPGPVNVEEQIKAIHQRFAANATHPPGTGDDRGRAPGT